MSIRINHNTAALFVRHNLEQAGASLEKTVNRLSSGERITRAGDDAAGLANSQALRSEVRSLRQNIRNVNDGISVTSTIESALAGITNLLNRIRDLAISSGNVAMSDANRQINNEEARRLVEEIARMAASTEFNGRRLLDGSYANARVQTGASSGQYIAITIASMTTNILGAIATVTGSAPVSAAPIAGGGDLILNSYEVPASADDGVSTDLADASARAKATAINAVAGLTGVTAQAQPTILTGAAAGGGSLRAAGPDSLSINGVNLGDVDLAAGDATANLVTRINMIASQTGVTAALSGGAVVLTAEDGRNIQIEVTGAATVITGLDAQTRTGTVTLTSTKTINVGGALGLIGFDAAQAVTAVDPARALDKLDVASFDSAQRAIETVDAALKTVLSERAQIGSIQNRLDAIADSLAVMIENLSASDSRIRDADFALETARMTRDQILQNAAAAILTQANNMPRSVLDYLLQQ